MQLSGKTVLWCALFALAQVVHAAGAHEVRLTGTVQAVRFFTVQVPQIGGQGGRVTLTKIIANGVRVKSGDLLAEFDRTQELDNARDAQGKIDRKSTRLNSSHLGISYAVFCLQ